MPSQLVLIEVDDDLGTHGAGFAGWQQSYIVRVFPFDEEHELSLSVCGADDALRLEVSAEVSRGV